jgi:hypothetical protein
MIAAGSQVIVTTADGEQVQRTAASGIIAGDDFPVVWICLREEWMKAAAEKREPNGVPFPLAHVRPVT